MPVSAVIGVQWGDEGKGKMVDYLAEKANLVVRYQGGANAGHTIVNERGTFKLRLIPSGICYPGVRCLLGPGVAVDPAALLQEMAGVEAQGVSTAGLMVAERATLVMPWHLQLDRLEEEARGARKIGTTLRGIGPAFTAKAARRGLQVADLLEKDWLADKVRWALEQVNPVLTKLYGAAPVDADEVIEQYFGYGQQLKAHIVDSLSVVRGCLARQERILLEGQLGVLRDPDWGTYPYVTSSSPLAGSAAAGAGVPPWAMTEIYGVAKAYTTAVGEGPFPSEQAGEVGDYLRTQGAEFGVVTGRPRRCGWFDAVATRFSCEAAGVTGLVLTKLDVLDGLPELKLCTGYRVDGQVLATCPPMRQLTRVEPVFETLPGWVGSTAGARSLEALPVNARRYIQRIEELVGVPVRIVSVGPERMATFPVCTAMLSA
ncbi:MAG TPA: adenylosuccinate synthase [Symbiobacteriaceae bacterium]|nr:adenylosuccinate synthase [Symbiobacteriaceae bacterium]